MAKPNKVYRAFYDLYEKLGPEAEPFINIEALWMQDNRLASWQVSTEEYISRMYFPGFKFESKSHFLWHFMYRDDPYLLLKSSRKPETYIDFWLRSLFVPNATHYKAEIALAMCEWEAKYGWKVKRAKKWEKFWEWPLRVKRVLSIDNLQGGGKPHYPNVATRTVYSWKQSATKKRDQRKKMTIPSGWRINCIEFLGDEVFSKYPYHTPVVGNDSVETYYRETWIWDPIPGVKPPQDEIITFSAPASPDLWVRHWLSKKKSP